MNDPYPEPSYPNWLGSRLLQDKTLLDDAQDTSMLAFLAAYTLHDSHWIGLWSQPSLNEILALIEWDSYWSDGRIPYPDPAVATWPILLISFQEVFQLFFDHKSRTPAWTISTAETAILSTKQRKLIGNSLLQRRLDPSSLLDHFLKTEIHHTIITSVGKDKLNIFHSKMIKVLCLDHEGTRLAIPDL